MFGEDSKVVCCAVGYVRVAMFVELCRITEDFWGSTLVADV